MPVYMYTAKTSSGKNIKGTLEAADKSTVMSSLKEKGVYPISVTEQSILQKDLSFSFGGKIKLKDIAVFCRQFSVVINAGISVLGCLDILRQQAENKKLGVILQKVYDSVQKGSSLSDAMREHKEFPSILLNMIEAGETSGSLDVSLERMAAHFEKENKLNQKVKSALTYPAVVSVIATIVVGVLVTFVVPNFVSMFSGMGVELPVTTKALIAISDFVKTKWYMLIVAVLVIVIVYKYYTATDAGKHTIDALKLKLPIFGPLTVKVAASRFARTLGTLLASGLSMITALEVVAKVVDNYVVAKGIDTARDQVSRGISLSQPLTQMEIFPPMLTRMLKIGEDTGSLEEILEKTASFYDDEVENAVTRMTTLLEPVIIVVMAVVVGAIVISIVQPMFQMMGGIKM